MLRELTMFACATQNLFELDSGAAADASIMSPCIYMSDGHMPLRLDILSRSLRDSNLPKNHCPQAGHNHQACQASASPSRILPSAFYSSMVLSPRMIHLHTRNKNAQPSSLAASPRALRQPRKPRHLLLLSQQRPLSPPLRPSPPLVQPRQLCRLRRVSSQKC